jgi:hypothetical protein
MSHVAGANSRPCARSVSRSLNLSLPQTDLCAVALTVGLDIVNEYRTLNGRKPYVSPWPMLHSSDKMPEGLLHIVFGVSV